MANTADMARAVSVTLRADSECISKCSKLHDGVLDGLWVKNTKRRSQKEEGVDADS